MNDNEIETEEFIVAVDFDKLIETAGGEKVVPAVVVDAGVHERGSPT